MEFKVKSTGYCLYAYSSRYIRPVIASVSTAQQLESNATAGKINLIGRAENPV